MRSLSILKLEGMFESFEKNLGEVSVIFLKIIIEFSAIWITPHAHS